MNLFRTKSISQIQTDAASGLLEHAGDVAAPGTLRRTLGVFDLTLMGIAAIIGAGIFAMVGKASYNGGPAVALLFVFTAVACAFSALCYAEFASRIPVAGSAYTYAYASMGEFIAWIIGWDLIVEYAIGNIAVAISWSDYFTGLLKGYGIDIPLHFTMDFLTAKRGYAAVTDAIAGGAKVDALTKGCEAADATVNCGQLDSYSAWLNAPHIGSIPVVCDLPALLITLIITTLVFIGIRESKFAANIMTVLKIGIILLVIFLGLNYVHPANWSPFAPNGISGVLKGVSAVFFAYIGFDALSTTAEECKNPSRDLPIAMILSLVICTILYIAIALVLTGMVSYTKLDVGDPLAFVFGPEGANLPWVAGIIAVSAVIALATVFLVFQIGQPRLWMAMSRDGLLPKVFSSIHPKFNTPWFATIITGIVVAIPALFMNLTEVTDLASIGTLFAFVVVCAGVLFKDKEFKESGTRYVPYINSQILLPLILIIVGFVINYFSPTFYSDLITITPAEGETMLGAFSHKIPMIFFVVISVILVFFSLTKKLSLIPILGLLSCLYLMTELGVTNWIRFGVWLLVGMVIYFMYGYKNSHLNRDRDAAVEA
ncbi:MAG TPA: amino acid permease [Pyrinomonadaceae bacterium]|nr:amino acid permease [Chloracidobacterium sp.]MBP9934187.1 amino acid permease [Pyrinomonadaceae bacterium]MBK9436932.1 amino acid permease [Chloracidobacterium sp.]MBL0241925.1 amino acid permease [Chloracidobacterium sp.]HQX54605.1 amino acid permease [Pyrinomonadaceae bacterium]